MSKDRSEQYAQVVAFLLEECGQCFSDVPSNLNLIAEHLGIDRRQAHSVLGTMTRRGVLKWDRHARTWTVIQSAQKVA